MSWEEHGLKRYPDYLKSRHWHALNEDILFRRGAQCYICTRKSTLVLHHVSYKHLYHEKLNRDLYILCFDCHTQAHFWTFFRLKVPLRTDWLILSMRVRRLQYCVQSRQFRAIMLWFMLVVLTIIGILCRFILRQLYILINTIWWWVLKRSLSKINIDIR